MRLGGTLASGPAAASWGQFETEVWAIHQDGRVYDRYWDGQGWHGWEPLGAPDRVTLIGQPAAAARDADRIDVMACGSDGSLWRRWWDGKSWVPWQRVEGAPHGDAVSCSWVGDRLDVYVRGDGGVLWCRALGLGA